MVGPVDGKAPSEPVGLGPDFGPVARDPRLIVGLPGLRASDRDLAAALRLDELDAARIREGLFGGIDDLDHVAMRAGAESCANVLRTSAIGLQKSDTTTISASPDGAKDGGKLARSVTSCTIALAILSSTLRLPVGRMRPGMPTRSPACTRTSASAKPITRVRSSLDSCASVRTEHHGGRAVRPDPHRMGGFPFLLAHIELVVAGGAAPVHAPRRLAREEAAVLPEILARSRPAGGRAARE